MPSIPDNPTPPTPEPPLPPTLSAGQRDTSFDTGTPNGFNAKVTAIVKQDDGKIIVGGEFTEYKGGGPELIFASTDPDRFSAKKIIRLNPDGSKDTSFDIGTGFKSVYPWGGESDYGWVTSIALQNDGKILVGVSFLNSYNGSPVNSIIRLNSDGSRDDTFSTGIGFNGDNGYWVSKIISQSDGKILVGGWFNQYNGESVASGIIRLNPGGTIDSTFVPNIDINGAVYDVNIQEDGKIILVGQMRVNHTEGVDNGIVRLNPDGSRDDTFNSGSGFINTEWPEIGNIANMYKAIIQDDGKILVGGLFNEYNGELASGLIRLDIDGTRDNTFDIGTGFISFWDQSINYASVNTLALQSDGKIIAGGQFDQYNGDTVNGIIRLNSDGTKDNTFNMGEGFEYLLLGLDNNRSSISVIELQSDGNILVGGYFKEYNSKLANNIIKLNNDGSKDTTFDIGGEGLLNGVVLATSIQRDGKILVGGTFTKYKGVEANGIIRLNIDGSRDNSFNMVSDLGNNDLKTISLQSNGKILIGLAIVLIPQASVSTESKIENSNTTINGLVRLNIDGSIDESLNTGTRFNDSTIYTINQQGDGKIIIGGAFSQYNGEAVSPLIRIGN